MHRDKGLILISSPVQIVGYGHIGSQLSVLAEAMGMSVIYYDVVPIRPLGSARQVDHLDDLLAQADFLTLHVPELAETKNMIGGAEISKMKDGAYLINNARGKVVDIPALIDGLKSGKLAGAAVDVFPAEPAANGPNFGDSLNDWSSELRSCPNLILTPHIGGSTEEAQSMIGAEVGGALIRYLNYGSTIGSVNFPEVSLRPILHDGTVRLCHVHLNQPGVLKVVNNVLGEHNVEKQFSDSKVRRRRRASWSSEQKLTCSPIIGRHCLPAGRHYWRRRGRDQGDLRGYLFCE
mgnify:CR=1 FL=1